MDINEKMAMTHTDYKAFLERLIIYHNTWLKKLEEELANECRKFNITEITDEPIQESEQEG